MDIGTYNLAAVFEHHARARPTHPAIVDGEHTLTYRELDALIRKTADHLAALGVSAGDRIGLALGDSPAHLTCLYALARLGAIAVPMDVRWSADEKTRLGTALEVAMAIVEPDDPNPPRLDSVRALDSAWRQAVDNAPGAAGCRKDRDLPFLFALSSGTTSAPSGPLLTHAHLLNRFINQWITLTFNSHDRLLAATPLYFGATRAFCLSTLFAGATVVLQRPPFDPAALPPAVRRHGVTAAFLVPTLIRRLLALPDKRLAPFSGLRLLLSSGASLHPDEREAVRARLCANFLDYYGTTEGGGISVLAPDHDDRKPGSVGRPAFMVDVEIVDGNDDPVDAGTIGRIRYRGPGVATAPALDSGADPAPAHRGGWFYPGDLGCVDADGYLYLRGRGKEVINRGGVNIYPLEIEETLVAVPGVEDAAVVGWPSREFGEEIAAFVVRREEVTEDAILRRCRSSLAPYKVPRAVIIVDRLPRNSSGKVLKNRLRATLKPI